MGRILESNVPLLQLTTKCTCVSRGAAESFQDSGEAEPKNMAFFDVLYMEHGLLLLQWFTTVETAPLRLTCRAFCDGVAKYPWCDWSRAVRDVVLWRRCFPAARGCAVAPACQLTDATVELVFGREPEGGNVARCGMTALSLPCQRLLTDQAFCQFTELEVLHLLHARHLSLSGAALAQLERIQSLDLSWTNALDREDVGDVWLADATLARVGRNLRRLSLTSCWQLTDAALAHLAHCRLEFLDVSHTWLTGAGFLHLKNVEQLELRANHCRRLGDAAFEHLVGVDALDVS